MRYLLLAAEWCDGTLMFCRMCDRSHRAVLLRRAQIAPVDERGGNLRKQRERKNVLFAPGKILEFLAVLGKLRLQKVGGTAGDDLLGLDAGLGADIFINGLLVILMLKSIMEPMTILQTATHELRDGNLDYKVPYSSKNEIGQVCADFEEMRQRLKESVEQQQKYEENRMQLIAGISHDLGTPLTTIKGYASGILDGIADTDEKKMRYVGVIYDTAQGMDTLVSELSMLSKLSLDKVPFYFEKIKAKDFFEEYTAYAADTLGEAGIEFIYNFECDEDREINIDPAQFRRVLNNLIDNSRKYGAEDGTAKIMLSIRNGENGHTEISIEDNGQGVPADERDKIFETFYRGDKARTGHKNGSGLGLAITKQITDRHGASIRADESELGGLKVIIDLPQAK